MKLLLAIAPTVVCITYSQLMTKWRVGQIAASMGPKRDLADRLFAYLTDPLILSAYALAFIASVMWVFVVERYAISNAFPTYIGLTVAIVSFGGMALFGETLGLQKIVAIGLIIAGVYLASSS